jgi:hypothetical protein
MVLWIKYERKADTAFNNRGLFLGVITQSGLEKTIRTGGFRSFLV